MAPQRLLEYPCEVLVSTGWHATELCAAVGSLVLGDGQGPPWVRLLWRFGRLGFLGLSWGFKALGLSWGFI